MMDYPKPERIHEDHSSDTPRSPPSIRDRPLGPHPRSALRFQSHAPFPRSHAHYLNHAHIAKTTPIIPPTNHARPRRKATPISLKPRPLHFPQRRCCSHAHLRGFCAGAVRAGRAGQRAGPRWRRRGRRAGGRAERRRRRTGGERGPPRAARPGPARRHGPPRRLLRAGGLRRGKAR